MLANKFVPIGHEWINFSKYYAGYWLWHDFRKDDSITRINFKDLLSGKTSRQTWNEFWLSEEIWCLSEHDYWKWVCERPLLHPPRDMNPNIRLILLSCEISAFRNVRRHRPEHHSHQKTIRRLLSSTRFLRIKSRNAPNNFLGVRWPFNHSCQRFL